jgi:Spy/CpxP family protein refolding chaperone
MKSAYELAMERLNSTEPAASKPLTAEQKAQLADLDLRYKAKLAERDIFLRKALDETLAKGDAEEGEKVRKQMANERARLEEEREIAKDKVRAGQG